MVMMGSIMLSMTTPSPILSKRCSPSGCGIFKPLKAFSARRDRADGYQDYCRSCYAIKRAKCPSRRNGQGVCVIPNGQVAAPDVRYNTPQKGDCRNVIHRTLKGRRKAKDLTVLILTGEDGREIPGLRDMGYDDSNMILVDSEPGFVHAAVNRNKAHKARAFEATLGETAVALEKTGTRIDVLNLDFCNMIAGPLFDSMESILTRDILNPGFRISVTYQAGRDQDTCYLCEEYSMTRNEILQRAIETYTGKPMRILKEGNYKGTKGSPMAWLVLGHAV